MEETELENGDKIAASSTAEPISHQKELIAIESAYRRSKDSLSAPNLYLFAVILKSKGNTEEAREMLTAALNKMPLLWSAWLELALIMKHDSDQDHQHTQFTKLKAHWAKNFWLSSYFLEK